MQMKDLFLDEQLKSRVREYWRRTQHVVRLQNYTSLMTDLSPALQVN